MGLVKGNHWHTKFGRSSLCIFQRQNFTKFLTWNGCGGPNCAKNLEGFFWGKNGQMARGIVSSFAKLTIYYNTFLMYNKAHGWNFSSQGVGTSSPPFLLRRFEIPPLFLEGYSHSHVVTFPKEGRGTYHEAATKFDLAFWECLGHLLA
jgi:hypothetical protein